MEASAFEVLMHEWPVVGLLVLVASHAFQAAHWLATRAKNRDSDTTAREVHDMNVVIMDRDNEGKPRIYGSGQDILEYLEDIEDRIKLIERNATASMVYARMVARKLEIDDPGDFGGS